MRSPPDLNVGPALGETMARPPQQAVPSVGDLGETMARPPQSLAETVARAATRTNPDGSLQATVQAQLAAAGEHDDPIRIGRFTVLRLLGEGGMGVVYAAYDYDLDRKVAIKLVRETATAGTQGHTSMLREAQAMAKLSHPNVVQIYEVGEHDEQVFVAMEFVKGRTLTAWLGEAPRTWRESRDMFVQAGHGIAAAHAEGLVHRDFKPDNVLIGADERARVADFGLAGAAARGGQGEVPRDSLARLLSLDAELSIAGAIQGTPAYMAPEQHLGGETDARSDLFAFCVALWEALAGERPFAGDTLEALAESVTSGALRPWPVAAPAPAWLQAALTRGLAVDPAARPATMDALLFDLTCDLRQPVRSRVAIVSAALGVFGLMTAAAVYLGTREVPPTEEELAEIAALTTAARDAAATRHWVYPAADTTDDTAIRRVVALEALEGSAATPARAEATSLRREFAADLNGLGDQYWVTPGAQPFARDFYVQSMIFVPTDARARDRSGISAGQFADLEAKATQGGFTPADIVAAELLAILADSDTPLRKARLAAFQARRGQGSSVQKALLGPLLGQPLPVLAATAPIDEPARKSGLVADPGDLASEALPPDPWRDVPVFLPPEPSPASDTPTTSPASDTPDAPLIGPAPPPVTPTKAPESKPARPKTGDTPPPSADASTKGLAKAKELAAQGEAARRRGELDAAEALFHQALAASGASVSALVGLCDVYFDRGKYDEAVGYAERAVAVAPNDPAPRMRLGDTSVKLLRYLEARTQYERARELGHPQAEARLQKLKAKLGE